MNEKKVETQKSNGEKVFKVCPIVKCPYEIEVSADYKISCKFHNRLMILKTEKNEYLKNKELQDKIRKHIGA